MKLLRWPALLVGLFSLVAAVLPVAAATADQDFADFQALRTRIPPLKMTWTEAQRWFDAQSQAISAAGLAFIQAHPADPRRWTVLIDVGSYAPVFIREIGLEAERLRYQAVTFDPAARAAWLEQVTRLRTEGLQAADATPAVRERLAWQMMVAAVFPFVPGQEKPGPVDAAAAQARLFRHLADFAVLEETMQTRASSFVSALENRQSGSKRVLWAALAAEGPSEAIRRYAAEKVRFLEMQSGQVDFRFTAADGREVDLVKLRGKVVLIDFWATWCGPCIKEMPNVIANYRKYHEQGFEIVGVALEGAGFTPEDTPAEREARLAAAKAKLLAFTAAQEMPWPQYCDGKRGQTELAVSFGITGVPAMLLVDQEGRIVTRNARGPKLEAEIRRLLRL